MPDRRSEGRKGRGGAGGAQWGGPGPCGAGRLGGGDLRVMVQRERVQAVGRVQIRNGARGVRVAPLRTVPPDVHLRTGERDEPGLRKRLHVPLLLDYGVVDVQRGDVAAPLDAVQLAVAQGQRARVAEGHGEHL